MDGFQHLFKDTLTTIWSAPNYCYRCGNLAAVASFSEDLTGTFIVYAAAPEYARKRVSVETTKEVPDYFLVREQRATSVRVWVLTTATTAATTVTSTERSASASRLSVEASGGAAARL